MNVLRWEDPPPPWRRGRAHDWAGIGADLKARPGVWALVAVCDNGTLAGQTARHIRTGNYDELGAGFAAVARTVDGEARVYARYVEEESR